MLHLHIFSEKGRRECSFPRIKVIPEVLKTRPEVLESTDFLDKIYLGIHLCGITSRVLHRLSFSKHRFVCSWYTDLNFRKTYVDNVLKGGQNTLFIHRIENYSYIWFEIPYSIFLSYISYKKHLSMYSKCWYIWIKILSFISLVFFDLSLEYAYFQTNFFKSILIFNQKLFVSK